ncbi:hypothetical protein ACET3X_005371 [Alternaria dauci]|uniref:Uncharacterized protein n=1 Tax=Alternaria dauci TaxID=48095 RepID=A0ABR3UK32_9PLEO
MYPQLPAGSSATPPRTPVTYSRHSASARTPHNLGAAIHNINNEARGEAAFDRISRDTRGTPSSSAKSRAVARAVTKAVNRPSMNGAQSRPGALKTPSVQSRKGKEKSDVAQGPETDNFIDHEENDIAEAIARSLGKIVADSNATSLLSPIPREQYDSDLAKAKIMSLFSNEEPVNHTAGGHSYKHIGSGSASGSTAPHTALRSLLDIMDDSAKAVEEVDPGKLATVGQELASVIRGWHNTVTRVVFSIEAAEHKRIQDVQAQLDYDRVVEDKHKKEMDALKRQVGAQMLRMQQDHHRALKQQEQAYKNLLAKQPGAEPTQPRTVNSPSPHLQDKVNCLANEIAMVKSENKTKVAKMQASHANQVHVLHQKIDRLADANALLRIQEKSKKEKTQEIERMKEANEDLLKQIKDLTGENGRLKLRVPPVPAFQFTAGGRGFPQPTAGGRGLSLSTRSDPGCSSREGSDGWSRKRARYS